MYTLFDGVGHVALKPLTYTKPVAELRVGILTIKEKWEKLRIYSRFWIKNRFT